MKSMAIVAAVVAAGTLIAADTSKFAAEVDRYLAAHQLAGVESAQALLKLIGEPCGAPAKLDTQVLPGHRARKVRCWGPLMVPYLRSWGLDAAELDPDALARGELPDVIFVTQGPRYSQGDIEMIYRAAAEGVHVVTLSSTNAWSDEMAKRLGFNYGGVLTIGTPEKGGVAVPNCPKLFEGFPAKARLDAEFGDIANVVHGMYLTGDKCLMCVADAKQGRIATAVAQYAVGRGAITLFGPRLYEKPNAPVCKRLLLNLIGLLPPAPKGGSMPFVYHPAPPEGKPYFELLVPGSHDEYLTETRPRDHVWHLAFFFSWKFINGRNFWEPHDRRTKNRVVSHRETPLKDGALLEADIAYELDGRTILREMRTVKATVKPNGDYVFDWTGRFEALDDLAFTSSRPKWDKEKGTCNGNGYAGLSMRLARNSDFDFAYTNTLGSVNARCYGDKAARIDVYAKSKRTGGTTRISFIADRPTTNYTLHWPERNPPDGFHFVAFPEMFNATMNMAKGERRKFHYVVDVSRQ